ncbi:SMP-30/gluconolactonase/LRE family protein [Methylobacterium sp. J-070]|uniref:SMP-30/gluconolactonase/LRE family protein n=1 Tax=Methylobacterium sp. J-070 TaxID=2836650 RepID=UPI001FBAA3DA|nr:SMP-30/gluconolactonase/LRE family protein [Methylobacterium sp. J-070]MCJ2054429.1 SMP-30/gluconolactonase/LRE family protein [Methylobacterium sp. J-070]
MAIIARRGLLAGAALLGAARAAGAGWEPSQRVPDPAVEVLDPAFARYRLASATVERVATGLRWAEGPVWFGDMGSLLFSDVVNDRIMKWEEASGALSVFRKPSNYANGNTRDRQGRLITCQHKTRSVTRTEHDGTITTLMDRFDGKPLNSPNDVVCHSDGAVWFTDPAFGPNPHESMAAPELPGNVYRIDPVTGQAGIRRHSARPRQGLAASLVTRRSCRNPPSLRAQRSKSEERRARRPRAGATPVGPLANDRHRHHPGRHEGRTAAQGEDRDHP